MGFLRSSVRHKGMLQRFIFANFSKDRYQRAQHKRDFGNYCRPGDPLEKRIEIQVSSVDLREAVCLYGREFRRWTIAELVERLKNLGVSASRAGVTAALSELALELELSGSSAVAPARTRDRMDPGAQIRALKTSFWRQRAPRKRGKDTFRGA
jgi:hypothetical protein